MTTEVLKNQRGTTEARTDLEKLQGAWVSVAGRRAAEMLFAGRHFTFRFMDGDLYMGTFDLGGTDDRPRTMIMWIHEGPPRYKGKSALCIYELDGDRLRWCPSEPGTDEQLDDFPPMEDGRHLCMLFRREQVQPKPDRDADRAGPPAGTVRP
jgi:uncharacterized protein (TIGR03067 family)